MDERTIKYQTIKEWSEDDRPREKLTKYGSSSLSNSELLAILIGSGSKGFSALDAAKELIKIAGNISDLSGLSIDKIKTIRGLGDARAVTLKAAFELAKRIKSEPLKFDKKIVSPEVVAKYYIPRFYGINHEEFLIILLNSTKKIIKDIVISKGILTQTIIHPREVFRAAIESAANSIILIHNHPSGNSEPSTNDIFITKELIKAGKILGIEIDDHIIIAGDEYVSLRGRGIFD